MRVLHFVTAAAAVTATALGGQTTAQCRLLQVVSNKQYCTVALTTVLRTIFHHILLFNNLSLVGKALCKELALAI
jgi:hypothetical protein